MPTFSGLRRRAIDRAACAPAVSADRATIMAMSCGAPGLSLDIAALETVFVLS